MTRTGRFLRGLRVALGLAAAVIALTWVLEHVMPAPYSGFLALALVGLVSTEVVKRQPLQRAFRMFRYYLRARERGADEPTARSRLAARFDKQDGRVRRGVIEASWVGESEKERAVGGVAALLVAQGKRLEANALAAAYDRARDQFMIPGWEALPKEFVNAVRRRLDPGERDRLDALTERYRLFHQKFFRASSALAANPEASVVDFARLLHSMGNGLA